MHGCSGKKRQARPLFTLSAAAGPAGASAVTAEADRPRTRQAQLLLHILNPPAPTWADAHPVQQVLAGLHLADEHRGASSACRLSCRRWADVSEL